MDALRPSHSVLKTEGPPDIKKYNANFVLNGRTIPYQAEISDKLTKAASQPAETDAPPKLYVTKGPMEGQEYELAGNVVFVGRSSNNDIKIKDIMVSRKHLKISRSGETVSVEDLKSTNGTIVNGETIGPGESIEMEEGDTIFLGNTSIQFGRVPVDAPLDVEEMGSFYWDGSQGGLPGCIRERRSPSPENLELEKLSGLFEQSLNLNGMLEKLLEYLLESLPRIDSAAILLIREEADIRKIEEIARKSREDHGDQVGRYSRGLLKRLIKDGKTIKVSNTTFEAQTDHSEDLDTAQTSSTLCVPIISSQTIRGVIYLNSVCGPYEGFRKEDLSMLDSMGGLAAVAIENANLVKN
jgi:pSer/pThr/pTyr-binding forkhead associated (FHA) protein